MTTNGPLRTLSLAWQTSKLFQTQFANTLLGILVRLGTLPYYRLYYFNTIGPIKRIAVYASQPAKSSSLHGALVRWRNRKLTELQFISIANTVLAGAVIGAFSWNTISTAYWLAPTFWYISLVLSILGILLSAQQVAVLHTLPLLPHDPKSKHAAEAVRCYLPLILSDLDPRGGQSSNELGVSGPKYRPKWKMVFTWQCPIMFMSYSVISFIFGLTLLVCTPLIRKAPWDTGCDTAVIYLAVCAVTGAIFSFCGFYAYRFVDLDRDGSGLDDQEIVKTEIELSHSNMRSLTFPGHA